MEQLSAWVGAGLVTAGVSAALLAGAGAASAATGSGADSGGSASSDSTGSDASKPAADATKPDATSSKKDEKNPDKVDRAGKKPTPTTASARKEPAVTAPATDAAATSEVTDTADTPAAPTSEPGAKHVVTQVVSAKQVKSVTAMTADTAALPSTKTPVTQVVSEKAVTSVAPAVTPAAALVAAPTPAPAAPSVLGVIQGVVAAVVVNVGSLAFNTVQAVEALVTGPPILPPNSTVTVQSSTILLSSGQRVAANWYYPAGTAVPEHMILLQHGFFALAPMYSYTAANLAEQTQSIVVTPTLSSNPFAGDANWLGGTAMAASIGELFEGNREALTQSAIDAGFAARYGPNAVLPQKFALAGHSLGANLVSGAAGQLADDCTVDECAADNLVGVILLDGVPVADTLPNALAALTAKQGLTGFIPVREIGAPTNIWNSTSDVNEALTAARPDQYKGVVLDGGVHSDSMQGGNPLIQFALYVFAGFPEPQNPPAVDELSVQWFNEWFAGDTGIGDDLVPGTTVDVATPDGTAHGVVIGDPPVAKVPSGPLTIAPSAPTTIPAADPTLAGLAA